MTIPLTQIEQRIKKVLMQRTTQCIEEQDIQSDVALVGKGLALDSVSLLEFIVGTEEEFGLILDDSALTVDHFQSISTLARYIQEQMSEQNP